MRLASDLYTCRACHLPFPAGFLPYSGTWLLALVAHINIHRHMSLEHLFAASEQRDVQSKQLFAEVRLLLYILNFTNFFQLKPVCTALLRQTLITPATASSTTSTLGDLVRILQNAPSTALTPSLIQYVFFPLSHLLRRNNIATLPNHLLERVFLAFALLAETWYWTCEPEVWEQLVMLASAVLAGLDTTTRDEETYLSAARTLRALIRSPDPDPELEFDAQARFDILVHRAQSPRTLPVLGKTLDALLAHAGSPNADLQRTALEVLLVLVRDYFPDAHVPSVMPGVTSAMCRVALDTQKAPAISGALDVLRALIVRGMSDEVCIRHGALRDIRTLDDLLDPTPDYDSESTTEPASEPASNVPKTPRTPSWLAATASQVHIALNALSPLTSHTHPSARLALVNLCADVLRTTPRALPQSQPLLLSTLLILAHPALPLSSNPNPPPADATTSLLTLRTLLPEHLPTLTALTSQTLSTFPHRLTRRTALILTTACTLLPPHSVGALLGPGGGIHKWGFTLLRVLKFESPGVVVMTDPAKLIEPGSTAYAATETLDAYPRLVLQTLDTDAGPDIEEMFISMGRAAHEDGMYAVEWFVGVARSGSGGEGRVDEVQVAALWCALMILRGAVSRSDSAGSAKIGKTARWVARSVAELWDDDSMAANEGGEGGQGGEEAGGGSGVQTLEVVEHIKGLNPITTLLDRPGLSSKNTTSSTGKPTPKRQFDLQTQHTSLSLQLLSTSHIVLSSLPSSHTTKTSSIVQPTNPSITLLQQTLYPLLHALLSPSPLVSSTAHTALAQISHALGYASPPNMLLANFDYALESVASRVQSFSSYAVAYSSGPARGAYTSSSSGGESQGSGIGVGSNAPSLSIQALHVLRALVRLVGRAIIDRAYDVLDECFDRLDEYHGYSAVVQALVEVLGEVVDAVGREDEGTARDGEREDVGEVIESEEERWEGFVEWFKHREDPKKEEEWSFDPPKSEDDIDAEPKNPDPEPDAPPPLPPSQSLTRHIIARSTYFLTHPSPLIRTRILHLLTSAAPTLRASALLPTIHAAWPFILNRLDDKEHYVVLAAAGLVEALSKAVGDFMARRVWDDIWPRFSRMLISSAPSSSTSLISSRNRVQLNTDAYGPLARSKLHLSILHTITSAVQHIEPRDDALWAVLLACRRFLRSAESEDVQGAAREMYRCVGVRNADAVWLVLGGLCGGDPRVEEDGGGVEGGGEGWDKVEMPKFLREDTWDVRANVVLVMNSID